MLTEDVMTESRVLKDLCHAVGAALRAQRRDPDWDDSREYITTLGEELHRIGGIKAMDHALWQDPAIQAVREVSALEFWWSTSSGRTVWNLGPLSPWRGRVVKQKLRVRGIFERSAHQALLFPLTKGRAARPTGSHRMTPSLELRKAAADLHDKAFKADQAIVYGEDAGKDETEIAELHDASMDAWAAYRRFTIAHGFRLATDVTDLFLRCGRTGIPLVEADLDGDRVEELETGELALREMEDAA